MNNEKSDAKEALIAKLDITNYLADTLRNRRKDAFIHSAIEQVVPNARKRFPDLSTSSGNMPSSEKTETILNSLTPEEQKAVRTRMEIFATGKPVGPQQAGVAAQAQPGVPAIGGPVNPGAPAMRPQAAIDASEFKEGVKEFRTAVAAMSGPGVAAQSGRSRSGGRSADVAADNYAPIRSGAMS